MSNSAMNAHIAFGSPMGDSEGLYEVADWAGDKLMEAVALLRAVSADGCKDVAGRNWYDARNDFFGEHQ
jgi:hypothetical protein